MTVSINAATAAFSKYIDWVTPRPLDEAAGLYFFGADAASSNKNLGNALPALATTIGAPSYSPNTATFSSTAGINTGINTNRPYTFIVVANAGTQSLMGDIDSTCEWMYKLGADLFANINNAGNALKLTGGGITGMAFYALTYSGTYATLYAHNGSTLLTNGVGITAAGAMDQTIKVGATYGAGTAAFAAAGCVPRVLSSAEILAAYTYLKARLAARGVTVV